MTLALYFRSCDNLCMIEYSKNTAPAINFLPYMRGLLTTSEAAEQLGVTSGRVRQLILAGRLPATKVGRDLFIKESDLKLVQDRQTGRPSKKDSKKGGKK